MTKKKTYKKTTPNETTVDMTYQRDLDTPRSQAIAKNFDPDLVGVVVLSERADGTMVRIDGQHRFAAATTAGYGDHAFLAEVHSGLTLDEEARLFLRLNGGRSAVRTFDKFKARLVAREAAALAIQDIAHKLKLRITKTRNKSAICAVDALDVVYRVGNLDPVLRTLKAWADGDPEAFDRALIKGLSAFLRRYPEVEGLEVAEKLRATSPEKLAAKIHRMRQQLDCSPDVAACVVFREAYNMRRKRGLLAPVDVQGDGLRVVA